MRCATSKADMGAGLAKAAYAAAARSSIDHAPARVFVFMALAPLDTDPVPVYFGGRDALAESMGAPATTSGFRAVERAISALRKNGLIAVAEKGAPGRRTRYRLLDGGGFPLSINGPRSAVGESEAPTAERPVSKLEHPPLSDRTPTAEWSEHPPLSVDRRRKEEKEEKTCASAPPSLPLPGPAVDTRHGSTPSPAGRARSTDELPRRTRIPAARQR